jgi:hypothetical protein
VSEAEDYEHEVLELFGVDAGAFQDSVALRIEFAPDQYKSVLHPKTHLHLNGSDNCRIPVHGPVGVGRFFRFLVKNFYCGAWARVGEELLDIAEADFEPTIDSDELLHVHINC